MEGNNTEGGLRGEHVLSDDFDVAKEDTVNIKNGATMGQRAALGSYESFRQPMLRTREFDHPSPLQISSIHT